MSTAAVTIEGVRKTFTRRETVHALDGVDLEVQAGELLVLLGPSGCGKSTLLRCVAGLEKPNEGRITLGDDMVSDATTGLHRSPDKRDIGLVFQTYVLWPHMTVRKNVAYPLKARRRVEELKAGRVDEVLDLVHCRHLAGRYPSELSGGQQQRIALARALAARPSVLLLDEPLSNLDALLRVELRAQLHEIHRELGYTGIYVTHDQAEALNLGDRIAVMEQGRIAQLAEPEELYRRPATEYVADFLGVRNQLVVARNGDGLSSTAGHLAGPLDGVPVASDREYRFYVRPEHLTLEPPGHANGQAGEWRLEGGVVSEVLYGGVEVDYVVRVADVRLFVKARETQASFAEGDPVTVAMARDHVLIYDAESCLV